ncbi:MAG: MarR family winged helix-turn-helix transcriptional regulator [Acidimicrobiia bacterium]
MGIAGGTTRQTGVTPADERRDDELVVLVVRAAKAIVDRFRIEGPGEASSPMTVVHGLAARYLVGRDDVTTVELAAYLGITKQSTSEVVGLLEHSGIVRRVAHPSDRRSRVLLLTDEGAAKLEQGQRRWTEVEDEWANLVGRDALDIVREALKAYLDADEPARADRTPIDCRAHPQHC